jgi:integration host factor subunit beta
MNKSDLIAALAEKQKLTEIQASDVVDIVFDGFARELKKNGRIEIRGFGSYHVKEYGAYTGRNPKTGTKTAVKPKRLPVFMVGKELRKLVNPSEE